MGLGYETYSNRGWLRDTTLCMLWSLEGELARVITIMSPWKLDSLHFNPSNVIEAMTTKFTQSGGASGWCDKAKARMSLDGL